MSTDTANATPDTTAAEANDPRALTIPSRTWSAPSMSCARI